MANEVTKLLNAYHANTLWEIAQAGGLVVLDPMGKRLGKRDVMRLMQAKFFTSMRILASLERLNERERAVLDRLLLRGGTASTKSLRREVLQAKLVTAVEESRPRGYHYRSVPYAEGYAGNPLKFKSTEFVDVIARLTYQGLVFSTDVRLSSGGTPYKLQYHPAATLYVPEIIRRYLPEPEPIPVKVPDWQPDQVRSGDPALLLRDLYLYWDFVRGNEVPLLQSGLVGKRSLKAIDGLLLSSDPSLPEARREDETGWLYLLRLLLEKLDLVHRHRGQLRLTNEDELHIPSFWTWSESTQTETCLEAWTGLGATTGQEEDTKQYSPRFAHARQTVLTSLQALLPNAWFELEEFLEEVQDRDPDFLFTAHSKMENDPRSWYNSYSGRYYYGSTKELLRKFEMSESNFVKGCLTGFLHQMGLVDVGYVRERWNAFRLSTDGKALLAVKEKQDSVEPDERGGGKLIVQPNFQIMAIGPVNLGWLARLDLFAERERADRGAFEYRISRDSVYRAQQLGLDVPEVLRFLEELNGAPLPQNVHRSLEEWGGHHERIVFRSGVSLLQTADAALLDRLMETPPTSEYLARSLSPQVALLKKGSPDALVAELVAQGLFPAVSGDQPESADGSVIVQENGAIQPIHAVPCLHLRARLSHVAKEASDVTWRLTAQSVRRSGGSKSRVLHLLEELGKLHRGLFPQALTEQIKAWGGYYGDAATETVTLIEFRDQDALEELKAHPDLQPYLIPFPAGNRALATVPGDKMPKIREILAGLGVGLRDRL
jgi:hypothetical protein